MTVELSVQEAQVTSEQIPIKVNSVKKDGVPVTSGLTYEYKCEALYTNEIIEKSLDEYGVLWDNNKTVDVDSLEKTTSVKEETKTENTYTFSGLERETCYKITVTVTDEEGNTGKDSVGILGFKISKGESPYEDSYYRATLGSIVEEWIESGYSKSVAVSKEITNLSRTALIGVQDDPRYCVSYKSFPFDPHPDSSYDECSLDGPVVCLLVEARFIREVRDE